MKSFNFKSATNTKEAAKLASGRTTFLAGGMTLLPAMKLGLAAYSDLINIKKIKALSGIKVSSKSLRIGATTTHAEVAASKEVKKSISSLADLADGIGDPQVRNRGTIGGSIANNDPAADYPSACLALNATIHTSKRKIRADKFFKGMFETDLKKGELIEAIEFKVPDKSSYVKFPNPASRYAIVGIYVAKLKKDVRVAVTGVESCVFRCKKLESVLSSDFSPSSIDKISISSKGFNADIHASAEYRANLIVVLTKKAVTNAK
ncbi:MAG: xanthine dehydrogenase family protein subunit M [Pelagibacterales bacterium]|nr:xanthine dehydrogenase family protein subunit M [Pelagibacterales bacterium]